MTALMTPLMTPLGQGMAGLALVMGFALLCVRQIGAASILLAVQSVAVAFAALVLHQPALAIPPVLLAAAVWRTPDHLATLEPRTVAMGGAKLGVAAALVLAVLCQSQSALALPLAVVLLSVLLAATRRHPLMHVIALVGLQNGIVLTGTSAGSWLPLTCLALPVSLAAGVLIPPHIYQKAGQRAVGWYRWVDLGLAGAILIATLLVPLDPTASIFAPVLGVDGVLRAWQRTNRAALSPGRRGLALLSGLFPILAVCPSDPAIAWLAVLACVTTSLLPTLTRRWDDAVLAVLGAGIALFGLTVLGPSIVAYFSIFAGFTAIAAVVPELAPVVVILILRLADHAPWPAAAEPLGLAIALVGLLTCAAMLRGRRSVTLLLQSQACIATLSICLGDADGRFAALVLLILLILSRSAARFSVGGASIAIAGLGGVPPLGVFPGVVLVLLAVTDHHAWLLLPIGAGLVPILLASLPRHWPALSPSVGWLPLGLALLTGYLAPEGLVRWWHVLTAGPG